MDIWNQWAYVQVFISLRGRSGSGGAAETAPVVLQKRPGGAAGRALVCGHRTVLGAAGMALVCGHRTVLGAAEMAPGV